MKPIRLYIKFRDLQIQRLLRIEGMNAKRIHFLVGVSMSTIYRAIERNEQDRRRLARSTEDRRKTASNMRKNTVVLRVNLA